MKQATSLKEIQGDLSLPGILVNTSPTDYRVVKQLQMTRFKGERWESFGPIISDEFGTDMTLHRATIVEQGEAVERDSVIEHLRHLSAGALDRASPRRSCALRRGRHGRRSLAAEPWPRKI